MISEALQRNSTLTSLCLGSDENKETIYNYNYK